MLLGNIRWNLVVRSLPGTSIWKKLLDHCTRPFVETMLWQHVLEPFFSETMSGVETNGWHDWLKPYVAASHWKYSVDLLLETVCWNSALTLFSGTMTRNHFVKQFRGTMFRNDLLKKQTEPRCETVCCYSWLKPFVETSCWHNVLTTMYKARIETRFQYHFWEPFIDTIFWNSLVEIILWPQVGTIRCGHCSKPFVLAQLQRFKRTCFSGVQQTSGRINIGGVQYGQRLNGGDISFGVPLLRALPDYSQLGSRAV